MKPTENDYRLMQALNYYIGYVAIGDPTDEELWEAMNRTADIGKKSLDNGWTKDDFDSIFLKEHMMIVLEKFKKMVERSPHVKE